MGSLRLALRFRFLTLLLCIGTIAANIPLYGWVRQDYIPTNVDESEFEVSVNAKEGTSILSMNQALKVVEDKLRSVHGVALTLTNVGSRGFGGVNNGSVFVRLHDAAERTFSLERFFFALLQGKPNKAFDGNFSQQQKNGRDSYVAQNSAGYPVLDPEILRHLDKAPTWTSIFVSLVPT